MKRYITTIGILGGWFKRASRVLALSILLPLCAFWLPEKAFGVGSWTALGNQPGDSISICLLLSDGTVG